MKKLKKRTKVIRKKKQPTIALLYHAVPLTQTGSSAQDDMAIADHDTELIVKYMAKMFRRKGFHVQTITVYPDDLSNFKKLKADYVFNLVDSKAMEIQIAKVLARLHVPHSGSTLDPIMASNNKIRAKKIFDKHRIPTPKYSIIAMSDRITRSLVPGKFPVIIKPAFEHCSVGINEQSVAVSFLQFKKIVKRLREEFHQTLIAEEFIKGKEFHITVLETENETRALPIAELQFRGNRGNKWNMYGFTEKWDQDNAAYKSLHFSAPTKSLKNGLSYRMQRDAIRAFYALGFRDYARFDVRYNPDEKRWYFLEGNANAGFCVDPEDAMTAAIKADGMTLDDFILAIVGNSVQR